MHDLEYNSAHAQTAWSQRFRKSGISHYTGSGDKKFVKNRNRSHFLFSVVRVFMVFIQVIAQVQTLLSFGWIAGCRSLNRRRILKIKEMSDPDLDSESLKMWLRPPLQQTRNSRSLPTILMQRRICLNATNSSAPQAAKNYMQALPSSFRTCATFRMGPSDHARLDAVSTDLKYWQVQAQRNDKRIEGRSWQLQYDFKRAKALDSWRIRGRSRAGLRVGGEGVRWRATGFTTHEAAIVTARSCNNRLLLKKTLHLLARKPRDTAEQQHWSDSRRENEAF